MIFGLWLICDALGVMIRGVITDLFGRVDVYITEQWNRLFESQIFPCNYKWVSTRNAHGDQLTSYDFVCVFLRCNNSQQNIECFLNCCTGEFGKKNWTFVTQMFSWQTTTVTRSQMSRPSQLWSSRMKKINEKGHEMRSWIFGLCFHYGFNLGLILWLLQGYYNGQVLQ